jgi:P pilus assembly chaperone PapD
MKKNGIILLLVSLCLVSVSFAGFVRGSADDIELQELPWEFESGMSSLTILVTNKTNKHIKFVGAMVTIHINGKPVASENTIVADIPPFEKRSMKVNFMNHSTFDTYEVILRFVDF